jgi:hypothetical protein
MIRMIAFVDISGRRGLARSTSSRGRRYVGRPGRGRRDPASGDELWSTSFFMLRDRRREH